MKWLDLNRLCRSVICARYGILLTKTVFCTAVPSAPQDVAERHRTYNNALRSQGVSIVEGHHIVDPDSGKRVEKQSDINVALHLVKDASDGIFDCAFILSSDSDQAATAKVYREWFPQKWLVGVSPPGNKVPDKIKTYADAHFELTLSDLEKCIFDHPLIGKSGKPIPRPINYNPPKGWVRPI